MAHDSACEASTRLDGCCECATRAYLADATPEERADWDARNSPQVRPRLDVSARQWGRA